MISVMDHFRIALRNSFIPSNLAWIFIMRICPVRFSSISWTSIHLILLLRKYKKSKIIFSETVISQIHMHSYAILLQINVILSMWINGTILPAIVTCVDSRTHSISIGMLYFLIISKSVFSSDSFRLINLCMVVENEICFAHKEAYSLYEMFHIRYSLHKLVCLSICLS